MSCSVPPPPPPLPGTVGAVSVPTYREQQQQQQLSDPIQEQLYANLPSKLSSAMNKDKKPFSYTLGAPGENGVLDLNQIKSPRMRRRLQANLKGDQDPRNEIKASTSPSGDYTSFNPQNFDSQNFDSQNFDSQNFNSFSPEVLSMMSSGSQPDRPRSPAPPAFKIPPPPAKSIRDLEKEAYYGGEPGQPYYHTNYPAMSGAKSGSSGNPNLPNYANYENAVDEQLAGLYKSLNVNDYNNNSPVVKNHNMSPKPFSPTKTPFEGVKPTFTPVQSPLSLPNGTDRPNFSTNQPISPGTNYQAINNPATNYQSGNDDFSSVFPRPPPPQMSLVGERPIDHPPRSKSPLVPNPPLAYAPTLQEQWEAKKQGSVSPTPGQSSAVSGQPSAPAFQRQESYDRKMHDIRESGTRFRPPNPPIVNMPTLQEQWEAKKRQEQQQQQVPNRQQSVAEQEDEKMEPIQSRSFKILQKMTEGFEEELEAFKQASEPSQRQQPQQQVQFSPVPDQWSVGGSGGRSVGFEPRRDQPARAKSPVVPNPPSVYAPTLQEQWMAKKRQQQQQAGGQPAGQSSVGQARAAPPPPQRQISASGQGYYPSQQYQQSPSEQQSQLFQRQTSSSSSGARSGEIIIPVRVEQRNSNPSQGTQGAYGNSSQGMSQSWTGFQDQPPSPRYTGSAFPSKAFQTVRLLTGEDPFFSSPSFLPSSYNHSGLSFTPNGTQGTDF